MNGIKPPKNGYVYAYISNQSDGDVYFDNFALTLSQGNIVEENHYYSFGLKIATISAKKYSDGFDGEVDNKFGMQGAYSEMDDDIGWNDFALRNYDPQIGRFVQQDPYQQFYSPYTGMGNDPVNLIDPSGGIGIPCPGTSALAIFLDGALYAMGNALNAMSKVGNIVSIASFATQTGITASNMIGASEIVNGQLATNAVGSLQYESNAGDGSRQMEGNSNEQINNYWVLYSGQEVSVYEGKYGDQSNLVKVYRASSGITVAPPYNTDYRNSKYQFTQDEFTDPATNKKYKIFVGPLPEGDYTINLSLNPSRQAKLNTDGSTVPGKGIEKITIVDPDGTERVRYPAWGFIRARLEASKSTYLGERDGNFYFHNSQKGYTHGCIETKTEFMTFLWKTARPNQSILKVKVKYKTKNMSTNGNTQR